MGEYVGYGQEEKLEVCIQTGGRPAAELRGGHGVCRLFLLLEGKADFDTGTQYMPLERGSLVLLCPEELHRLHTYGESQEWVRVSFPVPYLEWLSSAQTNLCECFSKPERAVERMTLLSEQQIRDVVFLAERLAEGQKDTEFGSDLMTGCYATQLIVVAVRMMRDNRQCPENTMPVLVQQTLKYVAEHIREPISIERLSKDLYHNRSYISRMFKEHVGISLQQYIIEERLDVAMHELRRGCSLAEASEAAGFNNYSNFIRTFTKHVGVSPHRYQCQVREISGHTGSERR